jgi:hypothetical protein
MPLHMFVEVLCLLDRWLCKHLSGIPFPATLDPGHSSDRCSSFPDWLFQVLNAVNTDTLHDLLHMPPEEMQGCQAQRA